MRIANVVSFGLIIVLISAAIAALGHSVSDAMNKGSYTEFYVLGVNGKAEDYPQAFVLKDGQAVQVTLDTGAVISSNVSGQLGEVTLALVNREHQTVTYLVDVSIDGVVVSTNVNGKSVLAVGPLEVADGQEWKQKIGFAPQTAGSDQIVEFRLFEIGQQRVLKDTLRLHINAVQQ